LKEENIHHSKHPFFCPLCERYEAGNEHWTIIKHVKLIAVQRGQYSCEKRAIERGDDSMALMTQDFTQIQYNGGFTQDLIICIYTYNPKEPDGLQCTYRKFISKPEDQNGIAFVIGCWKILLEENRFNDVKILIFGQIEGSNTSKSAPISSFYSVYSMYNLYKPEIINFSLQIMVAVL
jgi:hypothetical protein